MKASELRQQYLNYFINKKHKNIGSSSLVPENDPTTLFTSSGMQPLVPYLLGEKHPMGKRLVNLQKCFRAEDIEEVGDNRHTTFFEMMGNWSLGDYFKDEQLPWFFDFLVNQVKLDPKKIYVTVFKGSSKINIPEDSQSIKIWQKLFGDLGFDNKVVDGAEIDGMRGGRIFLYDENFGNWWSRSGKPKDMPAGEPGGPCTEVFYDFGDKGMHEASLWADKPCHPNCDCGRYLEIGNSVFMEYKKKRNGSFSPLPQKNVDFGGGFERILAASIDSPDIFKTDIFWPIIEKIMVVTGRKYTGNKTAMRVMADHLKAACFMINAGVEPGNKQQGYILRRLIRRAVVKARTLVELKKIKEVFADLPEMIISLYKDVYFSQTNVGDNKVTPIIIGEIEKFINNLDRGLKIIQETDTKKIDSYFVFNLWQSYGFPFEISQELLIQRGVILKKEEFNQAMDKHRELSRSMAKGMFKGGLANHSEEIVRLHTATHLLHAALRKVLGNHVQQTGSNITAERLRFDFTHPEKVTARQINKITNLVNQIIAKNIPVTSEVMSLAEARKRGALAFFCQKYPDRVKAYSVKGFSKELCGGPHVDFTGKLGKFMIIKEEAVGSGKRRIYGVLKEK